jgi:hypothetical protein
MRGKPAGKSKLRLERAIERSQKAKLIEGRVINPIGLMNRFLSLNHNMLSRPRLPIDQQMGG